MQNEIRDIVVSVFCGDHWQHDVTTSSQQRHVAERSLFSGMSSTVGCLCQQEAARMSKVSLRAHLHGPQVTSVNSYSVICWYC